MAKPKESIVDGSSAPAAKTAPVSLAALPSVDRLLRTALAQQLQAQYGASLVTQEARALLAQLRAQWREAQHQNTSQDTNLDAGHDAGHTEGAVAKHRPSAATLNHTLDNLPQALQQRCQARLAPRLRSVINLSGTVIHTNLGRSVLAPAALSHLAQTMGAPNNLEYDLARGERGERDHLVEALLCELTGAEAATVVNNNAAAVLLVVAALAAGREAVVSRGEQVEIGGAFRMPDVIAAAGAHMVEVGTTNRTHLGDYQRALNPNTALLLKVHTSNYQVQGFAKSVSERELSALAHAHQLPLASDLGSGALIDLSAYGLPQEPMPQQMLQAGCDVVTFSGDKLLGGPQAGLIVGRRALIERIRRHPLKRALRLSKLPLAALEATLLLYLQPEKLIQQLPTLRWLTRSAADVATCAQALCAPLAQALAPHYTVSVSLALNSQIGSGSLPIDRLASAGLAIAPEAPRGKGAALQALAQALRGLPTPIIGRIAQDQLLLDCRCLDSPEPVLAQLPALRVALSAALSAAPTAVPAQNA